MDITSLLGMVLGFVVLVGGMALKGASPAALWNPAALVIIFLGTAAALLNAFPKKEIGKFGKLCKILFTDQRLMSEQELLPFFVDCAKVVRAEGIIGLEEKIKEVDHDFLKKGFNLVLEGSDTAEIKETLELELETMEERHLAYASIFTQGGSYAPTLGVMGAVIGLVAALGNLNDIDKLGHSISAAFIATLFGIFLGYVICHPFANKLKRKSKREVQVGEFIIKGIMAVTEASSPMIVERKLLPYLPSSERNWKKEEA